MPVERAMQKLLASKQQRFEGEQRFLGYAAEPQVYGITMNQVRTDPP